MVRRKSRLKKSSKVREQRLLRTTKPILQQIKEARAGLHRVIKAMETKRTYAIYQYPTIMLHPRFLGGFKKMVREMRKAFPDIPFKIKIIKKGRLSSDIKVFNITPNDAILINAFFMGRGGVIKMEN